MRKYALLAAAAGLAVSGSLARADFIFSVSRSPVTTGLFAGDEMVVLSIQQGAGTAQTGNLISFNISESSTTPSPKFFIRTWDNVNGWYDTGAVAGENSNANADFGNEGFSTDLGAARPGGDGSYIRWGALGNTTDAGKFTRLATNPSENTPVYTDGQFVTGFSVTGGEGGTTGVSALVAKPLAVAIVPAGQLVTFSGEADSKTGTSPNAQFSIVPEPASFSLLGIGAAGLLARRRRQA